MKDRFHPRAHMVLALSLAASALAGCACDDPEWSAYLAPDAEGAMLYSNCEAGNLAALSETAAVLAARADPNLLAKARKDAERDCYRAAAQVRRSL